MENRKMIKLGNSSEKSDPQAENVKWKEYNNKTIRKILEWKNRGFQVKRIH